MYKNNIVEKGYDWNLKVDDSQGPVEALRNFTQKIKEEREKSPQQMTDEESFYYFKAMEAAISLVIKGIPSERRKEMTDEEKINILNNNPRVQALISSALDRQTTPEQLSYIIAMCPGYPETNPYLVYYKKYLMGNVEKSQKIIKAASEINFLGADREFDKTLLGLQLSQAKHYMTGNNDDETKAYKQGLATIFEYCAGRIDSGDYRSHDGKKMLQTVEKCIYDDKEGYIVKMIRSNDNIAKAYQKLQKSCVSAYERELNEISPFQENINVISNARDR